MSASARCASRSCRIGGAGRKRRSARRGFIGQELEAQRSLSDRGLTDLPELLRLERAAAGLDGQAGDIEARIAEARGRIAEVEIQILQIDTQRIEEAEGQAREVQAQENQVRERLAGVRERLGRLEVRAPVAGEVVGMQVFALREVVRPGEPILRLVPEAAGLVVRARLAADLCGPGVSGPVGGAALLGLPVTHDAALRGARPASVGGRHERRAHRDVVVRGGGGDGRRPGGGDECHGVAGGCGGLAAWPFSPPSRTERRARWQPCAGPGADAGHAGRGARPHRRALAAELPRQAADRLLFAVYA